MGILGILGIILLIVVIAAFGLVQWGKRTYLRGTMPIIMNENKLTADEIPDLSGKVIIVTGANTGLGKASTTHLARAGATVVMACRSFDKATKARAEILDELGAEFNQNKLSVKLLDLSSLASVRGFVEDFQQDFIRLDILLLNAGIAGVPFGLTEDGIERQIGTNHFGHFYLTELLLPLLRKSEPSSICSVSSLVHFNSYPGGVKLTLDELNNEGKYDPNLAYGQSKLANVLFVKELDRRLKVEGANVYVNAVHPGAVATELLRHLPSWVQKTVEFTVNTFPNTILFTPDVAALNQVYVAIAPLVLNEKFSGRYVVPIGEDTAVSKVVTEELQGQLWQFTEETLREKGF